MLVEFSIANFRSILERQTLSLVASADSEHAHRNLVTSAAEDLSLLRSAAIYGPNASGKSNLLRGLVTLRQLIEESATKVQEGQRLDVAPFLLSSKSSRQPSEFEIIFVAEDEVRYHYFCAVSAERVHRE
jgi:AAA15 family ATPase/GTPase